MKQFKTIICFFTLVFAFAFGAQAQEIVELEKTVVTATKTEHTLGDVPVAAEVITKEEIKAKNIKTVQDALIHLTGIKITKSGGSWGDKGKVQIQGLDASHTLILIDGQRLLGGHGAAIDLQQISIEMIERIEIVKGPAAALYGSDAIGGVVNIITRSAPKKPAFSASTAFGSRKTQVHEASGGFKKDKFGAFLNFTYRESDGVEAEYISSGKKQSDHYDEYIFQGNFQYDFTPQSKLSVKPYYSEHTTKEGISATEMQDRTQERVGLNSVWEWEPDQLSKLSLRGSWFNYEHYLDDKTTDWENDNYEGEINYSRLILDRHALTGGYHYYKGEVDDKGKQYSADQTTNSFFIQDEIDFEPITFVLGARVDDHDRWGTEVNPKASVLYRVTEDFKLRGSAGRSFRAPTLVKLYADGWRMGPWLVHANPDLKPEKSVGYQLGAEYTFFEKHLGKVSFFRNEIEDLISSRTVSGGRPPWDMYWENIDEATTQGIEASLINQLTDNLTSRLGYTYLDTENEETHNELKRKPKHKVDAELNWRLPEFGLNLNFSGQYIGKRYDDEENTTRLEAYTIFDFALTKDITKYGEIFFRVDNIFGKEDIEDEYDIDGAEFLCGVKITL